ncbi:MAG: nitroreductase family protein [Candidatus Coatesbacteria bacterium]|nr:MAG: nitroreductase family protein [Candidatus Coatesbacteria bacterium]
MEVFETIRTRRSIRRFRPDPLSRAQIERLLEAARWAPSAGNLQPWIFVVVTSPEVRAELAAAAYDQEFVAEAPAVVGVAAALAATAPYGGRGRELYCLQDTAAAVQNVLLAAHEMGLGTCWVGAFDEAAVARALGLGAEERPVALIPVGLPAQSGRSGRRELSDVVRWIE